jgi:hypothetical protein
MLRNRWLRQWQMIYDVTADTSIHRQQILNNGYARGMGQCLKQLRHIILSFTKLISL